MRAGLALDLSRLDEDSYRRRRSRKTTNSTGHSGNGAIGSGF